MNYAKTKKVAEKLEEIKQINCVFLHDKTCPVRIENTKGQKQTSINLLKVLKPESQGEFMIEEGMNMMRKIMTDRIGMGSLSEYCKICPFLKAWSKNLPIDR